MPSVEVKGFLTDDEYKTLYSLAPVVCVDLLLVAGDKFLLGKRINKPAQGEWFFPGGRVFKGETLNEALVRQGKKELGIDISHAKSEIVDVEEHLFDDAHLGGSIHNVAILYKVILGANAELNIDSAQHEKVMWFSRIDNTWHPYVKSALIKAGYSE